MLSNCVYLSFCLSVFARQNLLHGTEGREGPAVSTDRPADPCSLLGRPDGTAGLQLITSADGLQGDLYLTGVISC